MVLRAAVVAHGIITLAKQGENDPHGLCEAAIQSIRGAPLREALVAGKR